MKLTTSTPATDTFNLRRQFANEFLWMDDLDFREASMDDLLERLDQELGRAKQKYGPRFNASAQWQEAVDWLAERSYTVEG